MSRFVLTPQAELDLVAIWDYIARDSVSQADRVISKIESTLLNLAVHPELGHVREEWADRRRRPRTQEVDSLIGERTIDRDAAGLAALAEEKVFKHFYLVSQDPIRRRRKIDEAVVEFIPYKTFLQSLWDGELHGLDR